MTTLKRGQGTAVGDLEGNDLRLWWMSFLFLSLVVNLVNLIKIKYTPTGCLAGAFLLKFVFLFPWPIKQNVLATISQSGSNR